MADESVLTPGAKESLTNLRAAKGGTILVPLAHGRSLIQHGFAAQGDDAVQGKRGYMRVKLA